MMAEPSVREAMLAAVPSLRAFAISLSGNVDRADDLESGAGELEHFLRRQARGGFDDGGVEGGVIPPSGGEGREFA